MPGQLFVVLWWVLDTGHVLANVVDGDPANLDVGWDGEVEAVAGDGPGRGFEDVLDKEALSALELALVRVVTGRHHRVGGEERIYTKEGFKDSF